MCKTNASRLTHDKIYHLCCNQGWVFHQKGVRIHQIYKEEYINNTMNVNSEIFTGNLKEERR